MTPARGPKSMADAGDQPRRGTRTRDPRGQGAGDLGTVRSELAGFRVPCDMLAAFRDLLARMTQLDWHDIDCTAGDVEALESVAPGRVLDADGYLQLANLHAVADRPLEVEMCLGRALALRDDALARKNRGIARIVFRRFVDSRNDLDRAGDDPEAAFLLGVAWEHDAAGHRSSERTGLRRAEECYSKAVALRPGFAAAHWNRGVVRRHLGDAPGATDDARTASALDPLLVRSAGTEGVVLRGVGVADGWAVPAAGGDQAGSGSWNPSTGRGSAPSRGG